MEKNKKRIDARKRERGRVWKKRIDARKIGRERVKILIEKIKKKIVWCFYAF